MDKFLNNAARCIEFVNNTVEIFCNFLLIAMVLIVVVQVFCRYLLNSPISWSEEVALLILIWFGLLSVATAVYRDGHISITVIWDRLSKSGQYFLYMFVQLLILIFSLNITLNASLLVTLVASETLPASGIFRSYLYLAPVVAGALMAINAVSNLLLRNTIGENNDSPHSALQPLTGIDD